MIMPRTSVRITLAALLIVIHSLCVATEDEVEYDPLCQKLKPGSKSKRVPMFSKIVQIDMWNDTSRTYFNAGSLMTKYVDSKEFLHNSIHGAHVYAGKNFAPKGGTDKLPLIVYGSTFAQKYYEIGGITFDDLTSTADCCDHKKDVKLSLFGYGFAPSGLFAIDNKDGELQGWLTAGGNPFFFNIPPQLKIRQGALLNRGSIAFMPAQPTEHCPKLFPTKDFKVSPILGQTMNTVKCHVGTGVCFFSEYKFFTPFTPVDKDCLYWCIPDDIYKPTFCKAGGIVTYPYGDPICTEAFTGGTHLGGCVHGLEVGNTDPHDSTIFDLILIFTGGVTTKGEGGASHMKKLTMQRFPGGKPRTLRSEYFGEQLWRNTVELPFDVGLDHAWLEEGGEYLWVCSFRDSNPGVHMVEYATGNLVLSLHGFTSVPNINGYIFPSGISGYGKHGKPYSFIHLCATNAIQVLGTGVNYIFDISRITVERGDLVINAPEYP